MPRGAEDLGDWDLLVRELADWDFARAQELMGFPVRELLLAYLALLKERAREAYEHDLQVWAALAPHQEKPTKPPRLPGILRR